MSTIIIFLKKINKYKSILCNWEMCKLVKKLNLSIRLKKLLFKSAEQRRNFVST